MHILYKLTFDSGKLYIGQTTRPLKTRMTAHRQAAKRGSSLPVHCAWRVHGEPLIEVIGSYETHDELHAAEVDAIRAMNTISPNGYNVTIGGDTAPSKNPVVAAKIAKKAVGRLHTEEVKEGLSDALRARWEDPEYRAKVSAGLKAGWTPERRAAAAARASARVGEKRSEETKAKLRGPKSDETRRKMSAAAKGKVISEATRQKMSVANSAPRGPHSEERKRNLAAASKAAWQDPVKRERMLAARGKNSPQADILPASCPSQT